MGLGAVPGTGTVMTAAQIRDALQTLTGGARLDASAIKNLIVGGGGGPTDPLFNNVVLLLPLTTAAGISDVQGKTVTNIGTTASTAILDPFGTNTGVRAFGGAGARLETPSSSDFAFGGGAYAIEWWIYPTSFPSGTSWGLFDTRLPNTGTDFIGQGDPSGKIRMTEAFMVPGFTGSGLTLNQWNYICFSRDSSTNQKCWINGVLQYTAPGRTSPMTAATTLLIGDNTDSAPPFDGSLTGYASNLRITRAYRDGSIVPTAPFPTN